MKSTDECSPAWFDWVYIVFRMRVTTHCARRYFTAIKDDDGGVDDVDETPYAFFIYSFISVLFCFGFYLLFFQYSVGCVGR